MTHSSLLADLIDLAAALKADSTTGLDEKKRRDRRIGQALQQYRNHAARQIRGWLQQVGIPGLERAGQAGVQRYHVLCLVLAVAGLVTGAGLAQAVLFYTGDAPINTFTALAVLVLPQILLLLVWLITALPWKIPLFSSLRSALGFLHPGRLAQRIAGRFSGQGRHGLGMIWDPDQATVLAPAARWLFSFWSQLFSFGFNVGALLAIFSMIVFSDLAFVWSSTLDLDTATVQRVLSALAWPWHTLYPDAVPGHALIEVSRYYRLEEVPAGNGMATPELAAQLGGWWPFLVAAITCYGLLPRLATLVISWLALRRQLARALSRLPGAPELLARMNSPLITTAASQPENVPNLEPADAVAVAATSRYDLACAIVDWSGATCGSKHLAGQLQRLGIAPRGLYQAGGNRTTDQDETTIQQVCDGETGGVAITVKSWEPPMLEFLDFMEGLRRRCGRQQPLIVLLCGDRNGVTERDRKTWQLTLQRLGDPDLHVEVLGPAS